MNPCTRRECACYVKIVLDFSLQVFSMKNSLKNAVNMTCKEMLVVQQVSIAICFSYNINPWTYRLHTSMISVIIVCYKAVLVVIICWPDVGCHQYTVEP